MPVPVQNGNRDLTLQILEAVENDGTINTAEAFPQTSQSEVKAALDRLASRSMIQYETHDTEEVVLTAEGQQIVDEGSHEYKVWDAVRKAGKLSLKDQTVCSLSQPLPGMCGL